MINLVSDLTAGQRATLVSGCYINYFPSKKTHVSVERQEVIDRLAGHMLGITDTYDIPTARKEEYEIWFADLMASGIIDEIFKETERMELIDWQEVAYQEWLEKQMEIEYEARHPEEMEALMRG